MTRRPFLLLVGAAIGAALAPSALARRLRHSFAFTPDPMLLVDPASRRPSFTVRAILRSGPAGGREIKLVASSPEGPATIRIPVLPLQPALFWGPDLELPTFSPRFGVALYRHRGHSDRQGRPVYLFQEAR